MKISRLFISVAVAASFITALSGSAFAAAKMSNPHSDVTMNISKAAPLLIPGQNFALSEEKVQGVRVAGRRSRRRNLAFGAFLALGAAAIIANNNHGYRRRQRSYAYGGYNSYRTPRRDRFRRCDRLLNRCDRGYRRACRKFYRHCDF